MFNHLHLLAIYFPVITRERQIPMAFFSISALIPLWDKCIVRRLSDVLRGVLLTNRPPCWLEYLDESVQLIRLTSLK